jgi:putative ABC transport system ATP-binding protein
VHIGDVEVTGSRQRPDHAAPGQGRVRVPAVQPAADADREENILLPLAIAGRKPDQAWFDTVIDAIGLRDRLGHRPAQLSGGSSSGWRARGRW